MLTESNRIIMVDDHEEDLLKLSNVFYNKGIGCKKFIYDSFYSNPLKGVRMLFLDINLNKIPILTHYTRDGGAYITAGVVFARDPVTGIQNASIHRMMVLDNKRLVIRIVPRNLYTYFQNAQKAGEDLQIAIAIGMDPAILLASTTSIPIDYNEMEIYYTLCAVGAELIK